MLVKALSELGLALIVWILRKLSFFFLVFNSLRDAGSRGIYVVNIPGMLPSNVNNSVSRLWS